MTETIASQNQTTKRAFLASPWTFFAFTFVWTWGFWGIAILTKSSMETGTGLLSLLLGVMGPMVGGISFTYLTRDQAGRREYWKRVIDFRRITPLWGLLILLITPALHLLAAGVDLLGGGWGAAWGSAVTEFTADPLSLFFSIIFASLIPFFEELGWSGYVLDRLQERHNAVVSALILGVLWSLWHLPMFFIPGSYQAGLGVGSSAFWVFFIGIVPLSLVCSWVYINTNRSTLASILLHAMINFTGELILLSPRADDLYALLWFPVAIVVLLITNPATLRFRRKTASPAAA